jgi:Ca2+-binding RTX toxin-like protein
VNLGTGQAADDGDGGTDTLSGIEGLFGSEYSDVLIGDEAGNEFIGLGGDDTIDGAGGWDNVYFGNAPYWVTVDLATGEVTGGDGRDYLTNIEWVFGSDYSDTLLGNDQSNDLRGLWGDDEIDGRGGDDTLEGGAGDDTIDGGDGVDTAGYSGNQTSYTLTLGPAGTVLTDRRDSVNGVDHLSNVELLDFETDILGQPFDLTKFGGVSGLDPEDLESFIEMYIAYFNRAPDAVGLFFWGTAFGNGTTLDDMATLFIDQDETRAAYPSGTSNQEFAATVYENVLGRLPDADGFDFWVGLLDSQAVGRDAFILEVLRGAKASPPAGASPEFIAQQQADQAYLGTKTDIGAYFAVHKGMSDVAEASAAMALFDGSDDSVDDAVAAIDSAYLDALDPTDGAFLMPLIGVLEDAFTGQ